MIDRRQTLSKEERLSWKRHIDLLFAEGRSFISFPLRVVYLPVEEKELPSRVANMASVPKKKFKRANKRNLIKRLIRESYRIHKYDLIDPLQEKGTSMLVAFLYVDKEIRSFAEIEKSMIKALKALKDK